MTNVTDVVSLSKPGEWDQTFPRNRELMAFRIT